uniref:Multiple epidermal growth factor-like domains protein 10 isoform X7 n=1 Tax=Crassostrea virginica TaxID=6565 RepID=A0A8B8BNE0_CRAVI|nr:multiple epidermal growth factor-like domains protein 10 isoform X7 [Crassostrea virginica]
MSALYIILGLIISCCAYENKALHKQTYQQHPFPTPSGNIYAELVQASNAVDGLKSNLSVWGGQCVISDNDQHTATWWVNLNSVVSIHHITIYYRTGNANWGPSNGFTGRFLGFALYVSNTTNKSDGILCFKDTRFTLTTVPEVFNKTCLVHGQYVIYYNERLTGDTYPQGYSDYAYNELCELEVYGCPRGYYGFTCNSLCSQHCLSDCHIETGNCQGCKPGYQGNRCDAECPRGSYGQDCGQICYDKCTGCNNVNGSCDRGCQPGWKGGNCQQLCQYGSYGQNCTQTCEIKCNGCNNVNGACDRGCLPGWKGYNCQQWCPNGYYGQDCTQTCNYKCDGCNNVDGVCDRGCRPGWKGDYCQQQCQYGSYGQNCTQICNDKCTGCNNVNGSCDSGCKPGWKGQYCQEQCQQGSYGQDCTETCNDKCDGCNNVDGSCDRGCKPGWKGYNCQEPCPDGSYGQNCEKRCNDKCDGCNNINGSCDRGCKPGWRGGNCQHSCSYGSYGQDCTQLCNDTCDGCNNVNGSCDRGCKPGWKDDNCQEACTKGFYGQNCKLKCNDTCDGCSNVNGVCDRGCKPGWTGDNCQQPCPYGSYGQNCTQTCYYKCNGCNNANGVCDRGCLPGWTGDNCERKCQQGSYGQDCTETCNDKCDGCNNVDGSCDRGCKPGWKGYNCQEPCPDGSYGQNCEKRCNDKCDGCNNINGSCDRGCKPGWRGGNCQHSCSYGSYGQDCTQLCNDTCDGCNNVNGSCDRGCKPGWKDDNCQEACTKGFYGQNCKLKCNDTCDGCSNVNGVCDRGCKPGWTGDNCQQPCPYGSYGQNCTQTCYYKCNGCNNANGVCDRGCLPGWTGDNCERKCMSDFYGENCSRKCGYCLDGKTCHHINGRCEQGCNPGYIDPFCTEACNAGKYGLHCEEDCGNCSDSSQCFHVNGTCLSGCSAGYQGHTCKALISSQTASPDNTVPLVGAVVGVLVAAVVILVVVFIIRRKRTNTPGDKYITSNVTLVETDNQYSNVSKITKPSRKKANNQIKNNSKLVPPLSDTEEIDKTQETEDEDNVYMNETPSRSIPVEQLTAVIAEKRAKGDEGFRKEYAALPSGETRTCEAGKKPENIPKNRFKTTFPYDHSRVILKTTSEEASDYINANYINGTNRSKEYIAAQGPRQNTLNDFWKMIWQEEVSSIVMLTNLKEGDKIKCTQYWPNKNEPSTFGPMSIKMIEEKKYAAFIERKLSLNNKALNKTRMLTQYHYISWPDHGTPEPMSLLDFHYHVTSTANQNKVPTVVHCSAGVGRTGTYIALDALYQEGKKTGKVNVAEFVRKMRENRMTMVQTYEQYITIFLALNEIFKAPIQRYSGADFCTKTEKALRDSPANQNPLRKDFQLLLKVRPVYMEADYKVAKQMSAGRQTDKILPLDKYSLHLSSAVPKRGNYINAINVPSFTEATRFIVTRYPSPEDAVDFLRLLNDHESDTVICLDPVHEVESIQSWLPLLSSSTVVAPFTIHCQSNSRNGVSGHVIDILQDKQEDEAHSVLVIGPSKRINPCRNPRNTSELLQLVSNVLSLETDTPITVVSSDGGSLCGLFILLLIGVVTVAPSVERLSYLLTVVVAVAPSVKCLSYLFIVVETVAPSVECLSYLFTVVVTVAPSV